MSLSNHVRITLGDDEFELKPSLKAASIVSREFGGFNNALQAVAQNDLRAVTFVVRQGVTVKSISTTDLEEAVFRAGTRNLMGDVMKYITRLANGGRDPDEAEDDDGASGEDVGNGEL